MKKRIFLILLLSVVISLSNSCSSFLEENPIDRYVVGNFYSSQKDAEASVASVYATLYEIYERRIFLLNELPADDEKNGLGMPNQYLQDLEYLRHTSENQFAREMWQQSYVGIARANTAIENIPNITMDETIKNRLIGEAKFLRALYYFNLVRYYGDVPLVLKLGSAEESKIPRTPTENVYKQIIDDLTFAENNLPIFYSSSDIGRATQGAAKILLGKVYLTMHNYSECVSKLGEVIEHETSYGYGLHERYHANWEKDTENGQEMVFAIEFMDPPGHSNSAMVLQGPKYSLPGGFASIGLLSECNEADIPTIDLYSKFLDDDERKAATFRNVFVSLTDGSLHPTSIPLFVKYWEEGERTPGRSDCNMHIIRYADALLMYAEALNEVGQTNEALKHLNRVRERAFNSTNHNYSGLTQNSLREAVWEERRLELAMEGHRWFDLVRTGRFVQRMKEHAIFEASVAEKNKVEIGQNVKDYMILMPIPQREIDLNPNLVQNTGY